MLALRVPRRRVRFERGGDRGVPELLRLRAGLRQLQRAMERELRKLYESGKMAKLPGKARRARRRER